MRAVIEGQERKGRSTSILPLHDTEEEDGQNQSGHKEYVER